MLFVLLSASAGGRREGGTQEAGGFLLDINRDTGILYQCSYFFGQNNIFLEE